MDLPWLHRYSVLVAVSALTLVVTGALIPAAASPGAITDPVWLERLHQMVAAPVGILVAGLAVWISLVEKRGWLRGLVWIVVAMVVLEAVLGLATVASHPNGLNVIHALLAQLFFSAMVAIAVFTSRAWRREPELVKDQGWPSFRSLAIVTPSVVLAQVVMGASYRHGVSGVMPHLLGGMIVALLVLAMGVFVTQQFPLHRSLRPAAIALMILTFVQVALGLTVLIMPSVAPETSPKVVLSVVAHVTVGALALAATVVMSLQIRRNVRAAVSQPDGSDPSAA